MTGVYYCGFVRAVIIHILNKRVNSEKLIEKLNHTITQSLY